VVSLGFGLRIGLAHFGHNFDFDSFQIVAGLVQDHENVYASTTRYNYGPVWLNILYVFYSLASWSSNFLPYGPLTLFRYSLPFFLGLVDLGIMAVLWKKYNKTIAIIFFLNPISVFISGFHNQFGNLAVLVGLLAMLMYSSGEERLSKNKIIGLILLGISLSIKHILFLFPLWLVFKEKRWTERMIVFLLPITIFLFSFLPYLEGGREGIIRNVFLYESVNNHIFYRLFVPGMLRGFISSKVLWWLIVIVFGIIYRKKAGFYSLLTYLIVFVSTSPSIANQYLSLPMAFIAAYLNPFFMVYMIYGSFHLMIDKAGLDLTMITQSIPIQRDFSFMILVVLLVLGFLWHIWGDRAKGYFRTNFFRNSPAEE
jgi:hypothetical protein